MGTRGLLVIIAGLTSLHPTTASGRPPTRDEVQAWFDKEWEAAKQPERFEHVEIEYTSVAKWVLKPQELADLREAVKGKPEHPRRGELAAAEKHARGEWSTDRMRVWVRSPGEWRWSHDWSVPGVYTDFVVTPERAWSMSPQQLTVIDPTRGYPDNEDFRHHINTFLSDLGYFLTGGLRTPATYGFVAGPVQVSGDQWEVMVTPGSGAMGILYSGVWDPAAGRGFVTRTEVLDDVSSRASAKSANVVKGWRRVEELGRWAATEVDTLKEDGSLDRTRTLVRVTAVPPSTFEAVTATPKVGAPDAVRGVPTFASVRDYANGEWRMLAARDAGAGATTSPATASSGAPEASATAEKVMPLPRPGDDRGSAWHRWGGWVAAGGIAAALAVVVARRLRS